MAFDAFQILGHFGTQRAVIDCAGLHDGKSPLEALYTDFTEFMPEITQ
jgi:hypothetical protein